MHVHLSLLLSVVLFAVSSFGDATGFRKFLTEKPSGIASIPGGDGVTFFKNLFSDETKRTIREAGGNSRELELLKASLAESLTREGRGDLVLSMKEALDQEFGQIYRENEIRNPRSCEPVDLRTPGSPADTSPRQQANTQWCYAFSAARLLEQKIGVEVSPTDLAIQYYRKHPEKLGSSGNPLLGEFGTVTEVVNEVSSNIGVCEEKNIPVRQLEPCQPGGQATNSLFALQMFGSDLDQYMAENPAYQDAALAQIFPNSTKEQRQDVLYGDDRKPSVLRLAGQACAERIPAPFVAVEKNRGEDPSKLVLELDKQLSENKSFVGITVPVGDHGEIVTHRRSTLHAMTVVGRMMDPVTNECAYIIEDSASASRPRQTDVYRMDRHYTIMSRTNLMRSMRGIIYLEKK